MHAFTSSFISLPLSLSLFIIACMARQRLTTTTTPPPQSTPHHPALLPTRYGTGAYSRDYPMRAGVLQRFMDDNPADEVLLPPVGGDDDGYDLKSTYLQVAHK